MKVLDLDKKLKCLEYILMKEGSLISFYADILYAESDDEVEEIFKEFLNSIE